MSSHLSSEHELLKSQSWRQSLDRFDWIFALAMLATAVMVQIQLPHHMDVYEQVILWSSAVLAIGLGVFFKPLRLFIVISIACAYGAVGLYDGNIINASDVLNPATQKAEGKFLLRYLLSSQSAIMWQCALIILAFFSYLTGSIIAKKQQKSSNLLLNSGTAFTWASAFFGLVGLLVRWHESYLLRPDAGHIPISSLYEVFILFMVITALMYLYYEQKFAMQRLGAFVHIFLVIVVGFVLWYSSSRGAHEIQPLIPALQSWWMKIHVPANFVGYAAFSIAAMFGVAELIILKNPQANLPPVEKIDEAMYKAIAVGFLFFTIATILGALWAADAWGRYWSWDPKEVWALVVWLNYAVWLHLRLVANWRGAILAWWAVIGLCITSFAFLGVNMFLTGLHSYGAL